MRGVNKAILAFMALVMISAAGCKIPPGTGSKGDSGPLTSSSLDLSSTRTKVFSAISGIAVGPAELVGNNSAGVVSNNSAGLISNNSAGLVANNSAGYRTQTLLGEISIEDAVVYLTNPGGQFFKVDGEIITARTDQDGKFSLERAPAKTPVIVNIVLAQDRREVGFTVPSTGSNVVNVSLATTFVTEFLRDRALLDGKTMADYDLAKFPGLTERTEQAIAQGQLATPSLRVADIPTMVRSYTVAISKNALGLGDAWLPVLGYRVVAGITTAGLGINGSFGDGGQAIKAGLNTPKGLAQDAAGNIYVCEEGGHRIRRVDPAGVITTVAGNGTFGYSANGTPGPQALLNWPRTIAIGPDGNLYIGDVFNMRIRAICLKATTSYGVVMDKVGAIYDIAGDPVCPAGQSQCQNGYNAVAAPARAGTQTAGVRGIAFDSSGNLIFTDSWSWVGSPGEFKVENRHHVRVLAAKAGKFYGVDMQPNFVYTIAGKDGTYGFDGDAPVKAVGSPFWYIHGIVVDKQDNVYVADASNLRVRKISTDGVLTTFAGTGPNGDKVEAKSDGDGGLATAARMGGPYGLAFSPDYKTMFVGERYVGRIRAIDMATGIIRPVAGAGAGGSTADGDARRITLNQPHDLLVLPDGNLLETDARGNKVFKFLTQMGF